MEVGSSVSGRAEAAQREPTLHVEPWRRPHLAHVRPVRTPSRLDGIEDESGTDRVVVDVGKQHRDRLFVLEGDVGRAPRVDVTEPLILLVEPASKSGVQRLEQALGRRVSGQGRQVLVVGHPNERECEPVGLGETGRQTTSELVTLGVSADTKLTSCHAAYEVLDRSGRSVTRASWHAFVIGDSAVWLRMSGRPDTES